VTGIADRTRRRKLVRGGSHTAGRTSSQMAHPAGSSGLSRCVHGIRDLDGGGQTTRLDTPPGPKVRGGRMALHRIVVPVDTARRSDDALAAALRVADPRAGRLRLVHVRTWQPSPPPSREDPFFPTDGGELFTETPEQAADLIDDALRYVRDRGVVADGIVVEAPRPMVAPAIVGAAAVWGADAIVVCRRPRRTLGVLLRGRVCEQVLRDASCPVLVVGPRPA
jgi:nucleotide-binding universal stress UspA family protein